MILRTGRPRHRRAGALHGRALTVARLIARLRRDLGREPTDQELAQWLATTPEHIRRARATLAGGEG